MTINSYYAGRYSDAQRSFFCHEQVRDIQRHGLRDDTAYVFPRERAGWVAALRYGANYCRYVDNYILCSALPGQAGVDPAILRDVVSLDSRAVVSFAGDDPTGRPLLSSGWSAPEPWGRWMDGHAARLTFRAPDAARRDVRVELSLRAFVSSAHPRQRVELLANGTSVERQTLQQAEVPAFNLVIPGDVIGDDGVVRLEFNCPDAVSPASLGLSVDSRVLSIGIVRLRVSVVGN
jgi:hypothetical protein